MLCEAVCGIAVETEGNEVVSIRGDEADPFSRGHLCPKAVALRDLHRGIGRTRIQHHDLVGEIRRGQATLQRIGVVVRDDDQREFFTHGATPCIFSMHDNGRH